MLFLLCFGFGFVSQVGVGATGVRHSVVCRQDGIKIILEGWVRVFWFWASSLARVLNYCMLLLLVECGMCLFVLL